VDTSSSGIKEAYNDFKREINESSRQVTLFFYKFSELRLNQAQPNKTPPCKGRKKIKKEIQAKLL
jgi:hypothetical protein